MKSLTTAIMDFFEDQEIKFEPTKYAGFFKLGFAGDNGVFMGHVEADEAARTVLIETFIPVSVPKAKRPQIAELIARFNRNCVIGTLELDMDRGVVSFRTSIILGQSELHPDVMEHLLGVNWCAVDTVLPAVVAVIHGYILPKEAAENVRKGAFEPAEWDDNDSNEALNEKLDAIQRGSLN